MSLLSTAIVVAEVSDVEDCFWSSAQPAREISANAVMQEKIRFFISGVQSSRDDFVVSYWMEGKKESKRA